ncbi:Conserved oligomeric Golgi complex subunit [Cichlidogyrus casuarinus]|uniref:Conserved oligomeric Golgi complex subunit n=1 Tax=Cichlidogyrus casuarinus TaxID=1844966 RepID=A0ABD2Q7Y5_9PLAT
MVTVLSTCYNLEDLLVWELKVLTESKMSQRSLIDPTIKSNKEPATRVFCMDSDMPQICSEQPHPNPLAGPMPTIRDSKVSSRNVEDAIYERVTATHGDLLLNVLEIDDFQAVLTNVEQSLNVLRKNRDNLKMLVTNRKNIIKSQISKLKNLTIVKTCLYHLKQLISLRQKLEKEDELRIAEMIKDADEILNRKEYHEIDSFKEHSSYFQSVKTQLVEKATDLLRTSLDLSDAPKLSVAFHIFLRLNTLEENFEKLVNELSQTFLDETAKLCANSISMQARKKSRLEPQGHAIAPGLAALKMTVTQSTFNAALWTSLDDCLSSFEILTQKLFTITTALKHKASFPSTKYLIPLHWIDQKYQGTSLNGYSFAYFLANAFCSKKLSVSSPIIITFASMEFFKPSSKMTFLDDPKWELAKSFYNLVSSTKPFSNYFLDSLQATLLDSGSKSSQVKQALEGEYPRFAKLVCNLSNSSQHFSAVDTNELLPEFQIFLQPFETAYLGRSLARMHDKINLIFSSSSEQRLPSQSEIDEIVERACSELSFASTNPFLLVKVARNLAKTMVFFAEKIEQLFQHYKDNTVAASDQASQVKSSQSNNAKLVYILCFFAKQVNDKMVRRVGSLSSSTLQKLNEVFEQVAREKYMSLCQEILTPQLLQISVEALKIVNKVRGEEPELVCDLLQSFFTRISSEVLRAYTKHYWKPDQRSPTLQIVLKALGSVCMKSIVEGFMLNVALCRNTERLSLIPVCANFEMTLDALLLGFGGSDLANFQILCPREFTQLRGLRALLATDSVEEICHQFGISLNLSPAKAEHDRTEMNSLPRSLVLEHLFSRSPENIKCPQVVSNCSIDKYINWWLLDSTTEADRLTMSRKALALFSKEAQQMGLREYPVIYIAMNKLITDF